MVAEVETAGGAITELGTHPLPPGSPERLRLRDEQLTALAGFVAGLRKPLILAGDLNVTPWSPRFERLLRETGLTDTARGRGLQGTWPVGLPWMRIPIDHCLISESFRVVDRKVGPAVGSDHFPLLVDLELAR